MLPTIGIRLNALSTVLPIHFFAPNSTSSPTAKTTTMTTDHPRKYGVDASLPTCIPMAVSCRPMKVSGPQRYSRYSTTQTTTATVTTIGRIARTPAIKKPVSRRSMANVICVISVILYCLGCVFCSSSCSWLHGLGALFKCFHNGTATGITPDIDTRAEHVQHTINCKNDALHFDR